MEFQVLGSFEASVGGRPVMVGTRRRERLLAILLLEADRIVSIACLADLLWDGASPDAGRSATYTYIGVHAGRWHNDILEPFSNGWALQPIGQHAEAACELSCEGTL